MKKNILFKLFFFVANVAFCQIQNPSFELWDSGDPIYWTTSNFYDPGTAIQSADAHGGDFALNMNVVLDSNGTTVAPYAISVFPLTTMPEVLTFWIKGNLLGNNNINASFNLVETDSAANPLAYGDKTFTSLSNVYQYKFVNILALAGPSLLGQGSVYFAINAPVGSTLNVNSLVYIDDLYIGPDNTGIFNTSENEKVIEQLYPNPANDLAFMVFNLKRYSKITLKVYDLLGNLVQEVLNENMMEGRYKAEINTSQLLQGIYFCKLTVDDVEYGSKLIKR
jgi:hypothetical protein